MPTTRAAHVECDYDQLRKALHGFTVKLQLEHTSDGCKITGPMPITTVDTFTPGWEIQSKSDQLLPKETKPNASCDGGMECQSCKCDLVMVLRTPGIPTPWGSIGSITITTVQITVKLTVCADGSQTSERWIDGVKQ